MNPEWTHGSGKVAAAYSPCGKYLVTAGENPIVRRVSLKDDGDALEINIDNGEAKVENVDCSESNICVACDDGSVRLYELESGDSKGFLYRGSEPVNAARFNHSGDSVALACNDGIRVISVWNIEDVRFVPTPKSVQFVSWRPDGKYLCASCENGVLRIFEVQSTLQQVHVLEKVLPLVSKSDNRSTEASWSPQGDLFGIATKTLKFRAYSASSYAEKFELPVDEPLVASAWSPDGVWVATLSAYGPVTFWDLPNKKIIRNESSSVAHGSSIIWNPSGNSIAIPTNKGGIYLISVPEQGEGDDEAQEDDGFNSLLVENDEIVLSGEEEEDEPPSKRLRFEEETNLIQEPFQSGSTDWLDDKRYLCTNEIGYVWTARLEEHRNAITIAFFDQGVHRDIHFEDRAGFDLAALSSTACLMANSETGQVLMRFHHAFGDSWEYQLEEGEKVQSIALSEKVVVISTSKGIVRLFTPFGNPISVTRHARDPVVTCAAHENLVMVVRANASGSGLNYTLEDAETFRYYQKNDSVDVPYNETLTALFFSENGDPCIYDSSGTLSSLMHWREAQQARWVPIFDGASQAKARMNQEKYWPLGVHDDKLLCIILKGNRKYPSIPMPVPVELELSIPGLSGHESEYLIRKCFYHQLYSRAQALGELEAQAEEFQRLQYEIERSLLRQLHSACTDNRANKVLKIASLIEHQESLHVAAQIAKKYDLDSLAEQIMESSS